MTTLRYKAVRLDRTSHHDRKTKWRKGAVVRVSNPDPASVGPCGRGIHSSPDILGALLYQPGPSLFCVVEPLDEIASDNTKIRSSAVRVIRWLGREEQDGLAGFKLWEANHPVHPFKLRPRKLDNRLDLLRDWASVRGSVGKSVRAEVRDSVGVSVVGPVWNSVGNSMGASVWDSLWDAMEASVWAYIGGLFPNVHKWEYAEGPDPWRPLLTLWYAGYVPSFDGQTWRLHVGPDARVTDVWAVRR